jgi:glycopeptide antibiotics resistance protein
MTNTGGACIGYLIYCLLAKVLPSKLKKQLQAKHINSNVLVALYVICTFVIMVTGQRWVVHGLLNIP